MATVATSFTVPTKTTVFNRVQDRPLDPIQILRINHNSNSTGVGAGDNETITATTSLPRGYAYRVLNYSVTFYGLSSAEEAAWDAQSSVETQNDGVSTQYQVLGIQTAQIGPNDYNLMHSCRYDDGGPLFQIIDAVGNQPQSSGLSLIWRGFNGTSSIAAVSMNFAATIMQYDSESVFEADIWKIGNLIS